MERYGTIPKRFTKEWWDYFWYYYKWRVIFILVAVIFLAITCTQCAMRIDYDMKISYVGSNYYYEQNLKTFTDALVPIIDDKNGDGKKYVQVVQMNVADADSPNAGSEYNSAMMSKEAVEIHAGETYMFIMNKQETDRILSQDGAANVFENMSELITKQIPEDKLVYKDGVPYAVNISGNKFLADNGFFNEDVYMLIRRVRAKDENDEKEKIAYNNAVKVANTILEYDN